MNTQTAGAHTQTPGTKKVSQATINAAQKVFIYMALVNTIKPIYENIEDQIISTGTYHYDKSNYKEKLGGRGNMAEIMGLPEDRIITLEHLHKKDNGVSYRSALCHMAGLSNFCNSQRAKDDTYFEELEPNNDAARYYSELDRRAKDAGLINGQNALCIAENQQREAEKAMIDTLGEIMGGLTAFDIISRSFDNYKKIVELTLKMCSSFMDTQNANTQAEMKKIYKEHITYTKELRDEWQAMKDFLNI